MNPDLLVVGGGPVGLVLALLAHRRGISVEVVEPRAQPVDKACGEGIMPAGVRRLAELGVDPAGQAIRGIRYLDRNRSAEAAFTDGFGRGVRRTALQQALISAVRASGIEIRRSSVVAVEQSADSVTVLLRDATRRSAAYLAGADGLHSTVRRLCHLSAPRSHAVRRRGLRQHFAVEPWSDLVEVHWAADAEAYVTPVGDRLVGIALLTDRSGPFEDRLASFPALIERLAHATAATPVVGAGPFRQRTAARTRGRVALVGDAAGYLDAITGEGLSVGWRQASALVDAVAVDALGDYERAWRRIGRRSTLLTSGLLAAAGAPVARRSIVPAAAAMPRLFGHIVDLAARG